MDCGYSWTASILFILMLLVGYDLCLRVSPVIFCTMCLGVIGRLRSVIVHYENMSIEINWIFYFQTMKISR